MPACVECGKPTEAAWSLQVPPYGTVALHDACSKLATGMGVVRKLEVGALHGAP